jgi:hypothetical protein
VHGSATAVAQRRARNLEGTLWVLEEGLLVLHADNIKKVKLSL